MSGTAYGPDLSLNRDQEELLRTALSSNSKASPRSSLNKTNTLPQQSPTTHGSMVDAANAYTSPVQEIPGSATLGSFEESPFLDYELEDGNFDWDNSGDQLFGDLPGGDYNQDGEHHDKRKASIDDEDEEEGSSKRREGGEKGLAKKPGRKPLTGEPTTKRKAQNRAAQRAFRERKERHLKDLETKVDDLEKASEATNHENGRLRAQVDKLNTELKEYRKRLSLNSVGGGPSPPTTSPQARNLYNNNDFQFAFPKFGDLPSSFISNGSMAKTSSPTQIGQQRSASASYASLSGMARKESSGSTNAKSPTSTNESFIEPQTNTFVSNNEDNKIDFSSSNYDDLNGLFSPSILEAASRRTSTDYISSNGGKSASSNFTEGTINDRNGQAQKPNIQPRNSSTSITASPVSSTSQIGLDSSCGTTPESSAGSPDNRKASEGILNTINEETSTQTNPEAPVNISKTPKSDVNGIDWMAAQNGGIFDPVLFGDYRDPQDSILNNSFGEFFNDAFPSPVDFTSPYNTGDSTNPPQPQKRNLMDEIEVQQNGGPELEEFVGDVNSKQFLTCDKLWDRMQASEKVKSGAADMDELCSQLKAKAKCSGSGAVIEQKDIDRILGPAQSEQQDFLKMFS